MTELTTEELMDTAWRWRRESFDWPLAARYSRLQAAGQLLDKAINSAITNSDDRNTAHAVHLLANLEVDVGRLDSALQLWSLAVELCRELNDPAMLAHKIRHLGDLFKQRRQFDEAHQCYEEALTLYRGLSEIENNIKLDIANLLIRFAEIRENRTDNTTALEYFVEAESLYKELELADGVELCSKHIERLQKKS
ncbi:MAG: tetratricopeptide repeat protein [Pseudomonadales bacterium]|nr:tetratricopeptide repeat protein [Pseudomonadales bacterium]